MDRVGFGTDGWRGVIACDFTFDNLKMVVQAIVSYIKSGGHGDTVAVGYDTRFMSERFASSAASVVAGNGLKAVMPEGPVTSPMLSGAVKSFGAAGGIMITASHNPYTYNGVKFKARYGGSAGPEITREIEQLIGAGPVKEVPYAEGVRSGAVRPEDFYQDYERRLVGMLGDVEAVKGVGRVLFDCMHGAGGVCVPRVLDRLGIDADIMRREPDPCFGGTDPEPMERNLSGLMDGMSTGDYGIGFATDGDADRLGVVGPDGRYVLPHKVMGLLILHLYRNRGMRGKVARTVSMSSLIDRISTRLGLEVIETPVGFKNICGYMLDGGLLIGGEENGGLGVKGYLPERDGLLGALLLLEMMSAEKKGILELISDMESEFGGSYYDRRDIRLESARPDLSMSKMREMVIGSFEGSGIIGVSEMDGLKLSFGDGSWILFRISGTEPAVRVYCESKSPDTVRETVRRAMEVLIG